MLGMARLGEDHSVAPAGRLKNAAIGSAPPEETAAAAKPALSTHTAPTVSYTSAAPTRADKARMADSVALVQRCAKGLARGIDTEGAAHRTQNE